MCVSPKMPKIDMKEPAPPPPMPEETAAARQGSPELLSLSKNRSSSNIRNRLRIDRKTTNRSSRSALL